LAGGRKASHKVAHLWRIKAAGKLCCPCLDRGAPQGWGARRTRDIAADRIGSASHHADRCRPTV